jgi:hypothetical protein
MQKVSETGRKFSNPKPAGPEIQRLFRNSFQIWQSENADLEQIVLRLSGRAAQLVRCRVQVALAFPDSRTAAAIT